MDQTLSFNPNGKFKILQFTDVHWSDGGEKDQRTSKGMRLILNEEKPDFVALTGDLIYGEQNKELMHKALAPILEAGVPWAYVFGNHDSEWGHSRKELFEEATSQPNCMMQWGDPNIDGVGNYMIRLNDAFGKTKWAFYFLDSGSYNTNKTVEGYDFIHRSQIDWYVKASQNLQKEVGDHSALSFFHIPLQEQKMVWDYCECVGEKNEEVCFSLQNSGMFSAMLEMGNMRGVFVGHDHVNDYEGTMFGIRLCYGRATGYNTYCHDDFTHGARVIELDVKEPNTFKSWIHLDDNTVFVQDKIHQPQRTYND